MQAPTLKGTHKVTSHIAINASQHQIWDVISDFANVYTWAPSVQLSHALTNTETGLGAGRYCKLDGFGEIEEYVTEWQEGEGFVYDVTPLGPLANALSSWWLTPIDETTTRLTLVFSYDIRFGLFGDIMHKLVMRKKLQASLPQTLQALKTRVETGNLVKPLAIHSSVAQ